MDAATELPPEILPEYQDFLTRIADRVNSGAILADLPNWLVRNTKLRGKPWSFKDHEFQIAIARDQSPQKAVKKCSQMGLTELEIRLCLAYCRVSNGRALMYVLPYNKLATKIAKSRFDPVIEGSTSLSNSLTPGANSADFKRIGDSLLYITGAETVTSAISAPIDRIIVDERDFCRERVLGILNSRMRHADNPMRDDFSTPTIGNFGISAAYEKSDQKRYTVKCLHCNKVQAPSFIDQVVIPGYDKPFKELEKEDFTFHRYEFEKSYVRCIRCGKELDTSFPIAQQRQWIAAFPGRAVSGYAVKPYDLYKYNQTPKILLQYSDYSNQQDYFNFVLGEELDTKENKVDDSVVAKCFTGMQTESADDCYVGIDVGKTLHIFILVPLTGKKKVIRIEKIRIGDGPFKQQIVALLKPYNFRRLIIDAGPDISLPPALIAEYGPERVQACTYVKGKVGSLTFYEVGDTEETIGTVKAARTKGFDHMVKQINHEQYEFCRGVHEKEVRFHMQQIARKEEYNEEGEKVPRWVKLDSDDHYFHACFYAHLAAEIDEGMFLAADEVAPVSITGVSVGAANHNPLASSEMKQAMAMFGVSTARRR